MAKQKRTKGRKVTSRGDVNKSFSDNSFGRQAPSDAISANNDACSIEGCDPNWINRTHSSAKSDPCSYCRDNIFKSNWKACDLSHNDVVFQQLLSDNITKSEVPWLISAYNCYIQKENSNRNEITILALGIRQYMKEVFNSLDSQKNGCISLRDIRLLCKVLGKSCVVDHDISNSCLVSESNKCEDLHCSVHIHFDHFFNLVGKCFSDIAPISANNGASNSKLIDAVINISRRGNILNDIKKALENLEKEAQKFQDNPKENGKKKERKSKTSHSDSRSLFSLDKNKNPRTTSEAIRSSREHLILQETNLLQQQELHCLRELVEDLRSALQCSDAENLCLRVKLESTNDHLAETLSHVSKNSNQQLISGNKASLLGSNAYQSETNFKDSIESFLELLSSESSSSDEIQGKLTEKDSKNPHKNHTNGKEECHDKNNMGPYLTKEMPEKINQYTKQTPFIPNILNSDLDRNNKYNLTKKFPNFGPKDNYLEDDLQQMFERLRESQAALESTRMDLGSAVLQVQEKDLKLKSLLNVVKSMKANLLISESKSFRLRREFDKMKTNYLNEKEDHRNSLKDKGKFKEEADLRALQVGKLQRELQRVTTSRKSDVAKLKLVRELLVHSLSTLRQNGLSSSFHRVPLGGETFNPGDSDVTKLGDVIKENNRTNAQRSGQQGADQNNSNARINRPQTNTITKRTNTDQDVLSSRLQRNHEAEEKQPHSVSTPFELPNGVEVTNYLRGSSVLKCSERSISDALHFERIQEENHRPLRSCPGETSQNASYLDDTSLHSFNTPNEVNRHRRPSEDRLGTPTKRYSSDRHLSKENPFESEKSKGSHSLTWDPSWSRKSKNRMRDYEEHSYEYKNSSLAHKSAKISASSDLCLAKPALERASSTTILEGIETQINELRRTLDLDCRNVNT